MPGRDPIQNALLLIIVALGSLTGCASSSSSRSKEHASTSLLESGPTPKVTSRQAADMQIEIGRSMEEEGKHEEARTSYIAALKKDPKRADAELRLAVLDDRKGDQAAADGHFERALKLEPRNPEILCDRGYSHYRRRRWSDAEESLKMALEIDPSHARSHANLGLVFGRQGDHDRALAEFAKAGCDPSDARANLGLIYALEGRFEDAKREYARALVTKPSSAIAKEGLKAAAVAATGGKEVRAIASNGKAVKEVDPALLRTSAPAER
jgi:Tfp pilus assembly protein PilF